MTKKIFLKKIRSVFNENTNKFCVLKKKTDLYLMKIQISFYVKKIKSVFNENIDQFCVLKKKIRFVFNENTDLF